MQLDLPHFGSEQYYLDTSLQQHTMHHSLDQEEPKRMRTITESRVVCLGAPEYTPECHLPLGQVLRPFDSAGPEPDSQTSPAQQHAPRRPHSRWNVRRLKHLHYRLRLTQMYYPAASRSCFQLHGHSERAAISATQIAGSSIVRSASLVHQCLH